MEPGELLAQGIEFARAGDQKQARELIAKAVKADPSLKQGWWALAHLLDDKDRQLHCLKQMLKLDPANKEARAKLEELQGAPQPGEPAPHTPSPSDIQEPPSPRISRGRNRYVYIAVAVVSVILVGVLLTWLVASGALQGLFGGGQDELANLPVPSLPVAWTPTLDLAILVPTFTPTPTATQTAIPLSLTQTKTVAPALMTTSGDTPTVTPTFNPRLVATMTPSSPETCPDASLLGPLNLTHPQEDWYAPAEEILQYLNAGGSLDEVKRALNEIDNFHTELQAVDLTNDGVSEIVLHTFAFYVFGKPYQPHCERCPETARLLGQIPNIRNAMFSILSPRYHITPHRYPSCRAAASIATVVNRSTGSRTVRPTWRRSMVFK